MADSDAKEIATRSFLAGLKLAPPPTMYSGLGTITQRVAETCAKFQCAASSASARGLVRRMGG